MIGSNLTPFFNTDEFAQAATIKTGAGATVRTANVIKDVDADNLDINGNHIEGNVPIFFLQDADAAGVLHGYSLTIGSSVYSVVSKEVTGAGFTILKTRLN
jgi:hypothetical protein